MLNPNLIIRLKICVGLLAAFSFFSAIAADAQNCVATPNRIAWWRADGNAVDSIGSNHGVYGGQVNTSAGGHTSNNNPYYDDYAFTFNGGTDAVFMPNSDLLTPTGSLTLEAWILPTNFGGMNHILTKWGDTGAWANQRAYYLSQSGQSIIFGIASASNQIQYTITNFGITYNAWNHVAAVYDNTTGTQSIYINGNLIASRTDPPIVIAATNARVAIGSWWRNPLPPFTQQSFHGRIDDVQIYDAALTQTQIQANYNAVPAPPCLPVAQPLPVPAAQLLWLPGDGDGKDIAGNLNDGLLNGGVGFGVGKVGQSFKFDGIDDAVVVGSNPSLAVTGDISIEAWVKPTTNKYQAIVSKYWFSPANVVDISYGLFLAADGTLDWFVQNGDQTAFRRVYSNSAIPAVPPDSNDYTHVTATFSPTNQAIKLYINGVETAVTVDPASTDVTSLYQSSMPIVVGSVADAPTADHYNFAGEIDEVSLYSRVLTPDEILNLSGVGQGGKIKSAATGVGFSARTAKKSGHRPSAVATSVGDATITFPTVTAAGTTVEKPINFYGLPSLPSGNASAELTYDISTTAVFTGSPEVCFHLPALTADIATLRIFHLEGGVWVNRTGTISGNDVCTTGLTSLSPFAIAKPMAPSAATASITGRILTANGQGITNAVMTVSGGGLARPVAVKTSSFGYYRFDDLPVGQTYVVTVASKRFTFANLSRVISLTDDVSDADFTSDQ